MANVSQTHPSYDEMKEEWQLVKACSSGSREVKKLGTAILPAPGATEASGGIQYDKVRYGAYLRRAIYTNVTGRTKTGLTGAAFRIEPVVDLPVGLEYLEFDADGAGQSITQLSKDTFASLLEDGRQGLLTDYPEAEDGLTAEQVARLELKATIKRYGALDVINWKTQNINGSEVLTLVVLRECYNKSDNEFQHDDQFQYRVLRLGGMDESNTMVYSQQVYRDNMPIDSPRFPRDASGSLFPFIPFFIVGAQNNDASVDDIPLGDIAHVNVGHFRNSADLEENSFIHGQLTLGVTSSLDSNEWDKMNPNGIVVGSQAGHFLGENGAFTSVQADANQLTDKLQERKEAQMLSLGARLVEQRNPNETAAAAKIDATGENSVLGDLVANVEEGIQRSIEWCGLFMGADVNGADAFKMNRQFFDDSIDPQMVMASIQLFDRSVIAKSDLQQVARRSSIVDQTRTDEEINSELGAASPLE
jgi:hypothetical protein